jgi:lysylphosphatidylglycerol synthetase-like protein (DUF2156 family)
VPPTWHIGRVRRLLVFLGVMWIATNLLGAWVSVRHHLPYDLKYVDSSGASGQIGDDWLHGWGTGLAMPLWFVSIVAILTVVATFGGNATKFSAALLVVAGAISVAFTLSNQPSFDRIKAAGADHGEAAIVFASLLLASLLVLVGFLTVITTPKQHRY